MKSGTHNIEIENGSTYELSFEIENSDSTPYLLAGYSANMQVRNSNNRLILDCANYVSISGDNGIILSIPASATKDINDSSGLYQIEISNGGSEYSILRGSVKFIQAVIK